MIAENLILKQKLIIHSRSRQSAPNLSSQDRALLGFWSLFLNLRRIARSKNPSKEVISEKAGQALNAIVEVKKRNPHFGRPGIARQINLNCDLPLDKGTD